MSYRKRFKGCQENQQPADEQQLQRDVARCCKSNDVKQGLEVYRKAR